jgi:hypothetical protein
MNREMRTQLEALEEFSLRTSENINYSIDEIKGELYDTATRLHV